MERSYYYLGGDELHSGMYVALIRRLEQQGLVTHLMARLRVSLRPDGMWKSWRGRDRLGPNSVAEIRKQIRGTVHQVPIFAPIPGLSVPIARKILRSPDRRADRIVLHTRQVVMGRLALSLKRRMPEVRVIYEMEGDPLAEMDYNRLGVPSPSPAMKLRWAAELRYYAHEERRLVQECDAILCVSQKLKEVMVQRYRLSDQAGQGLLVFPSVGDPSLFHFDPDRRRDLRRALGIDDRFVVIYSGNMKSRWQVPDKLVEAFTLIHRHRKDAFFLILCPEEDRPNIGVHVERAGISAADHRMLTAPHAEIPGYLCAADVGLFLRELHAANRVAAPGKFSEYMLSGLPTIMTDGIGDFSDQVKDAEFACVLPDPDRLGEMQGRIAAFCDRDVTAGQRIAQGQWAAERFSTDLKIPELAALYRRL